MNDIQISRHLVTTRAKPQIHRRCSALILVGWSQGLLAQVDPYPLTPDIQIVAILCGRELYSLHMDMLVRRLGNSPVSGPVLMAHRCGQVLPVPPPAHVEPIFSSPDPPF